MKSKAYVSLAYMTGILPISKYSSGSELNMFMEYDMSVKIRFSNYFGFTEDEVKELYRRYIEKCAERRITLDGLTQWYDGYHTASGERMYNPRSVVCALMNNQSEKMLRATLESDTETMAQILQYTHDTETPILSYNHETELSAVVNLAYLSARDRYRIEREDKSGRGYVDFIFYPVKPTDDCIILELKVNDTPENAIEQIKQKQYDIKFKGKLGETSRYKGRILAVGISYNKKDTKHYCKVEVLQ